MRKAGMFLLMVALGVGIGLMISGKLAPVEGQANPGTGFAAVPGGVGSEDLTGPYEVEGTGHRTSVHSREMNSGRTVRAKACSRKVRIAFTCCSGANFRKRPRQSQFCCRSWGPALAFLSQAFGVMLRQLHCRGQAARMMTRAS